MAVMLQWRYQILLALTPKARIHLLDKRTLHPPPFAVEWWKLPREPLDLFRQCDIAFVAQRSAAALRASSFNTSRRRAAIATSQGLYLLRLNSTALYCFRFEEGRIQDGIRQAGAGPETRSGSVRYEESAGIAAGRYFHGSGRGQGRSSTVDRRARFGA
jgi:hypothetical protein